MKVLSTTLDRQLLTMTPSRVRSPAGFLVDSKRPCTVSVLLLRRVVGGHRRAILMHCSRLTDPNTSKEAKDHAKAKLEQHGVAVE